MNNKKQFLDYILSHLESYGSIRARSMFGGYGIYYQTTMFGLIAENVLYFRVDEENRADYELYEAKPFTYQSREKQIVLPYLELPEDILHNTEMVTEWIEKSIHAAIRYKLKYPKKLLTK